MLLWSRRSRAGILIGFAVVVLVVFVAPLATVVIAGLAGSWTEALPSNLGLGHFHDAAVACAGRRGGSGGRTTILLLVTLVALVLLGRIRGRAALR